MPVVDELGLGEKARIVGGLVHGLKLGLQFGPALVGVVPSARGGASDARSGRLSR
jgi:hypothetical protein